MQKVKRYKIPQGLKKHIRNRKQKARKIALTNPEEAKRIIALVEEIKNRFLQKGA